MSRPYERFPDIFANQFWREYPYLLPCLVAACCCCMAFIATMVVFKEVTICIMTWIAARLIASRHRLYHPYVHPKIRTFRHMSLLTGLLSSPTLLTIPSYTLAHRPSTFFIGHLSLSSQIMLYSSSSRYHLRQPSLYFFHLPFR